MRQKPAPSIMAASSSPRGSASKNCLKMKTATAVGTCGRMTAQKVLRRPTLLNSRNCGTMSTCPGIMMPAMTNQKTQFFHRKFMRDSANAAMLAVTTVNNAVIADVMALAAYQRSMSVSCSVLVNAANVGLSMSQGLFVVSAFGLSAVSNAQASGTSHKIAKAMRTPRQIRLNSFVRVSTSAVVTRAGDGVRWARSPGVSSRVVVMSHLTFLGSDDREPDGRNGQHDYEEEHRQCGRIADPEVREALVVYVLQHRSRAEVGAARGHDVHLVEDLQRCDDLEHCDEGRRAGEKRDGDAFDLLPGPGAVDLCRFVQLPGYVL